MTSTIASMPRPTSFETAFSRHSNNAGAPLPHIPRRSFSPSVSRIPSGDYGAASASSSTSTSTITIRTSSSSPTSSGSVTPTPSSSYNPPAPIVPVGAGAAEEDEESESSTSSSSSSAYIPVIAPRAKRARTPNGLVAATSAPESGPSHEAAATPSSSALEVPQTQARLATEDAQGIAWPLKKAGSDEDNGSAAPRARAGASSNRLRIDLSSLGTFKNTSTTGGLGYPAMPGVMVRTVSAPHTGSAPVTQASTGPTTHVRKKTGEPLKSSLKARRPVIRGDLAVVTIPGSALGGGAKSEPNTPTHIKSVHFDAKLEHVKLFLAQQKPLAVSRDGSPREDTSGTESDFPAFIYGRPQERERAKGVQERKLVMRVSDELLRGGRAVDEDEDLLRKDPRDVVLEEFTLAPDGLRVEGRVRVRNVAFEKVVAVRFTFDEWQTTNEVVGRHLRSSAPAGEFDWFAFAIRLNDLVVVSRIEGRTMWAAVRYRVGGREVWDNNGGRNYRADFERVVVETVGRAQGDKSKAEEMEELKDKLEMVAQSQNGAVVGEAGKVAPAAASSSSSSSSSGCPSPKDNFDLRSKMPLSGRYDFSASLKKAPFVSPASVAPSSSSASSSLSSTASSPPSSSHARPPFAFTHFSSFTPSHARTKTSSTVPVASTTSARPASSSPPARRQPTFRTPFARDPLSLTRGSPRVSDPADNVDVDNDIDVDGPAGIDQRSALGHGAMTTGGRRGSHRGGYHDLGMGMGMRHTKAGLPGFGERDAGMSVEWGSPRFPSFPPMSYSSPSMDGGRGSQSPYSFTQPSYPPISPQVPSSSPSQQQQQLPSSASVSSSTMKPSLASASGSESPSAWMLRRGGSEESTPSVTSASEESSRSSSPTVSIAEPLMFGYATGSEMTEQRSPVDMNNLSVLLNKFCFYTGSDSLVNVPDVLPRSHSASSVEGLLLSSPHMGFSQDTPTRSSSYNDMSDAIIGISGGTTPTFSPSASTPPSAAVAAH